MENLFPGTCSICPQALDPTNLPDRIQVPDLQGLPNPLGR